MDLLAKVSLDRLDEYINGVRKSRTLYLRLAQSIYLPIGRAIRTLSFDRFKPPRRLRIAITNFVCTLHPRHHVLVE
jgi:hypothetical protein